MTRERWTLRLSVLCLASIGSCLAPAFFPMVAALGAVLALVLWARNLYQSLIPVKVTQRPGVGGPFAGRGRDIRLH